MINLFQSDKKDYLNRLLKHWNSCPSNDLIIWKHQKQCELLWLTSVIHISLPTQSLWIPSLMSVNYIVTLLFKATISWIIFWFCSSFHLLSPFSSFLFLFSAGVGRTGTFIAIDVQLQRMQVTDDINVKEMVLRLRAQRASMVQTVVSFMKIIVVTDMFTNVHWQVLVNFIYILAFFCIATIFVHLQLPTSWTPLWGDRGQFKLYKSTFWSSVEFVPWVWRQQIGKGIWGIIIHWKSH